jgi:deoxyribonuclease-4
LLIGAHVSIEKGLSGAAKEAFSYGANTFMIYTGAPQNTIRKPVSSFNPEEGHRFMESNNIHDFIVHAPYLINLASPKNSTYELAVDLLKKEITRTKQLGAKLLVLHPGAFTESDISSGIAKIISGLNNALSETDSVTVCLETMAGKGTEIGGKFEELNAIIKGIEHQERIGVCLDTCHIHDSGYDITDTDALLTEFDNIVGKNLIKVVHLNGSLHKRGAKKDRHANIGAGADNPKGADNIGLKPILSLIKLLPERHFILETPWISKTENLYKQEIEMIRKNLGLSASS